MVVVHPNNPDGRLQPAPEAAFRVIDESFCDICPEETQIALADRAGVIVLKSFGKFWGLAGMRLGFAIGDPALLARLEPMIGPWAVSGPALVTATHALRDADWATATRARLAADATRLDALQARGVPVILTVGLPDGPRPVTGHKPTQRRVDLLAIEQNAWRLAAKDDRIKAVGGSATLVPLDVTDGPGIDRLGLALYERFGRDVGMSPGAYRRMMH